MKKTIASIIIILTVILSIGSVIVYADFGSGVATIAEETKVIKTGLYGRKISFSDADIKQALCIDTFDSITVTSLPKSTEGTLMLAGRRISEGTQIKRKNLASMVFIPATKEVGESSFRFTVEGYADGKEISFVIKFTDKINYEPTLLDEHTESLAVSTQRDIGVWGKMKASDPEGDKLEYIVVSYPQSGLLTIKDKSTGEYFYTPSDSFVGEDKFVYVARDEWGNFSSPCTVEISVSKRMSEVIYTDMVTRPEYNAAVAMTAMGIMGGTVAGDGVYFNPDETVTRAEFVCMAMKCLGMNASNHTTFFDDDEEIPEALKPYIASAQKMGIISGKFTDGKLLFSPNETITKYEAAMIMANLTNTKTDVEAPAFADTSDVPVWARGSVYAMCSLGIFEPVDNTIGAKDAVTRADCAQYLYKLMK